MIVGDAEAWINQFRRFDERLLPRIVRIVPKCVAKLGRNALEDDITLNLVNRLAVDPIARGIVFFEYQHHPSTVDEIGSEKSTGEIDFVAHFSRTRKIYLAYECKRLNIPSGSSKKSLATEYVKEGVHRFVTEQYSEGLPMGCMLGYVLDGDVPDANAKVRGALKKHELQIALDGEPVDLESIQSALRFSSRHKRAKSGLLIEVRHSLVSCMSC
ncbi:hypothetical protein [Pelagibius sp.]|uniref:hypothetical protein n=1 Tax=Pelagibius sp. TaxID=1931238 RepID=UPI003BB05095